MSDNPELNEFGHVPDSPEAYQAAAAAEGQPPMADPAMDPATVPAPPVDDISGEAPAADQPPVETPQPPAEQPAAPAAPEVPQDKVEAGRTAIPGLHEDADTLGLEGRALETKIKLSKEPKVRMMIPFDPGEKAGAYRTVVINGYRFDVKKNVMVDLPESVAALLANSYRITSEVVEQAPTNLANAGAETRSALGLG